MSYPCRRAFPVALVFLLFGNLVAAQTAPQEARPLSGAAAERGSGAEPTGEASQEQQSHPPIHIVPYGERGIPPKSQTLPGGRLSNNGTVQYWGGPVISQVEVVEVQWGSFVNTGTGSLQQFFTDITTTNYFDLLAEYSTVGLTGFGGQGGSSQTISSSSVPATKFTINPLVCPGSALNAPCSITDSQIQTEIIRQLNSGGLPQPVQDAQGNLQTLYMIYFPPGVTISLQGTPSCQPGGFCAYHSTAATTTLKIPYGVLPDFSQGGCAPSQGCGNGSIFDNLTVASSHELAEAVTDVDVGIASSFGPPLGWADQVNGEEIADLCTQNTAPVTVNGSTYSVQAVFSNMQNFCVFGTGRFTVTPTTTAAVPGTQFQVTVTPLASVGFGMQSYNDTVHFSDSAGTAVLPADYTFVPNVDNGSHTFNVTLNAIGSQNVTVNDTVITGMTGQTTVDIEHNPDLTVNISHSGSFKQGDTGDTYTILVNNSGDTATNATQVTMQLNLPFGMTVAGLSGTGWTCNSGTLQCTRADAVAARNPYPAITLTVNVNFNAPATITPFVQVSGGGEANTSNNQASDPTNIIQFPDLVVSIGQNGPFSQGQVNAQYLLGVQNVNSVASSGAVTVTDTLPSGLTATAINGTGWTCSTLPALSCTRSDPLGGGAFYPPITLAVNVDPAAPPSVTNTASVSGGGEVNTGNDSASNLTAISPPTPDVAISASHSAKLTQGETGATYTLIASNVGSAATNQPVTVSDSLPIFFTATDISGSGWSCSLGSPLRCSRSDSLPAFTGGTPPAYPPVTITFDIAANAISQQTNFASVSGGGEGMGNTLNDTQVDQLNIIQLPNLTVNQSLTTQLAQGLTGVNYSVNVSNVSASGPTSGTVTATAQLSAGITATAITGNGWNCTLSNLTCTRSDSLAAFSFYPSITVTFNVAANAPSTVSFTATVTGGGEIITSDDTQTLTTHVQPPISFTSLPLATTVTAGSNALFTPFLSAPTPGTINVTCSSGVPAGANCNPFPPSFPAPFNGPITITVTTTRAVASAHPGQKRRQAPLYAALVPFLGLLALGRRKTLRVRFGALAAFVLVLYCLGCGGGGSSAPPIVPTPPGTYSITVTATNTTANSQSTTTLMLIVQ